MNATSTKFSITPKLYSLASAFEAEGYEFYFVGGMVRDTLMQSTSWDVDATTNARPDAIKTILRREFGDDLDAMYTVGEKYGTVGIKLGTLDVEITTYRTEQYTAGDRKPEVQFGDSLLEDLSRRDFTINAIACDKDANIIDPFGGVGDIENGIVQFVGKPFERILEDPLRMLRMVRFASRYEFTYPMRERFNVQIDSSLLELVSKERIRDELCKMLMQDKPSTAIRMLNDLWLLRFISREVVHLEEVKQISPHHYEDAFEHTMRVLDLSAPLLEQRLAALLHDTGKWLTEEWTFNPERTTFHGHEEESARLAHRFLHRLRFPHITVNRVTHLVGCHMRPLFLYNELDAGRTPSKRAVRRFIHKCYFDGACNVYDVMLLNYADMQGHASPVMKNWYTLDGFISLERDDVNNLPEQAVSPLDGNEIMELFDGKPGPGPWVGQTKGYLTELVLDGIMKIEDKDLAREKVREYWNHTK